MTGITNMNNLQMVKKINETSEQLAEIAQTGTTVEVVQNKVSEMAEQGLIMFNTVKPQMTTFMNLPSENLWKFGDVTTIVDTNRIWQYKDYLIDTNQGSYTIYFEKIFTGTHTFNIQLYAVNSSEIAFNKILEVKAGNNYLNNFILPEGTVKLRIRLQFTGGIGFTESTNCSLKGIVLLQGVYNETLYKIDEEYMPSSFNEISKNNDKIESTVFGSPPLSATKSTLVGGETILLETNHVKKNKQLAFEGKINTFTKIIVGHGKTKYSGNYIEIDSTKIYVYFQKSTPTLIGTYIHGLNISEFIRVIISVNNSGLAKIILSTVNGSYIVDDVLWVGSNGEIFAESSGSSLAECTLSWSCDDYKKNIYAFGDSYFEMNNDRMWTYYINKWGFDNWLVNGYSGGKSTVLLTSLDQALTHGTPKYVLWCLGMNDADSSTTINSEWLSTVQGVISRCLLKGIEPILATIPNVKGGYVEDTDNYASRNHSFKNAWVRSSGYRYIDFDKAVNANITNEWYEGMLNTDGVHPTALGGMTLAGKAIVDFPELMQK